MFLRNSLYVNYFAQQLIDASGRKASDSRCISDSIDHAFMNYLYYSGKFRNIMKIKSFPQGEGMMNSLGGILTPTKSDGEDAATTPGSLKGFWKILDQSGYILNWNGEVSFMFISTTFTYFISSSYHQLYINCTYFLQSY